MARPNIEAERARMGMTKEQLCSALGISYKTYMVYVRGGGMIPSTVLEKLRDMTGKSIDYLLGYEN